MRIVNREEFLKLPSGTMYAKYQPRCIDELEIKRETVVGVDFHTQGLIGIASANCREHSKRLGEMENGAQHPIDFESYGRDGLFDQDQLFMVLGIDDVKALHALIGRLIDARS